MSGGLDWSATGTMISGIGTWAGVMALLWATTKGRQSLSEWRHQKALDREMAVAEHVLVAAYDLQAEIEHLASMFEGSKLSVKLTLLLVGDNDERAGEFRGFAEKLHDILLASGRLNVIDRLIEALPSAKAFLNADCVNSLDELRKAWVRLNCQRLMIKNEADSLRSSDHAFVAQSFKQSCSHILVAINMALEKHQKSDVGGSITQLENCLLPKIRGAAAATP